jgi:hypothetical protein
LNVFVIVFGESEIKRAGRVEFDVDSCLLAQGSRESGMQIATPTREIEKLVVSVGFDLRQQHSSSCPGRFSAEVPSLNETNIAHTAQHKHTRDG